jgi:hypothetical protein
MDQPIFSACDTVEDIDARSPDVPGRHTQRSIVHATVAALGVSGTVAPKELFPILVFVGDMVGEVDVSIQTVRKVQDKGLVFVLIMEVSIRAHTRTAPE